MNVIIHVSDFRQSKSDKRVSHAKNSFHTSLVVLKIIS